jgi:hypothetical protein
VHSCGYHRVAAVPDLSTVYDVNASFLRTGGGKVPSLAPIVDWHKGMHKIFSNIDAELI